MKPITSTLRSTLILTAVLCLAALFIGGLVGCDSAGADRQIDFESIDVGAEVQTDPGYLEGGTSEEAITHKSDDKDAATIPQVQNLRVADTIDGAKIKWDPVEGAEGYEVFHSTRKDKYYGRIAIQEDTYFAFTEMPDDATSYFKVRAYGSIHGATRYGHLSMPASIPR